MRSSVEIYDMATRECEVVWQTEDLVEAPNWSRDGEFLVINGDGLLYALPLDEDDPEPELIDTSFAVRLNNDHGISPDGASIVFSDHTLYGKSCIYMLGDGDDEPRQVTTNMPSYWHGWSPDGKELCCLLRENRRTGHKDAGGGHGQEDVGLLDIEHSSPVPAVWSDLWNPKGTAADDDRPR